MNRINAHEVGMVFGGLMAIWHAMWAVLVALGIAQAFMTWIFGLHFINMQFSINPFSLGNAVLLVIVTGVIGYVMGFILGWLWNMAHRRAHQ